jgi:predicted transcriptional regulator
MVQSVVELAKDLTLALIETGKVSPEDLHATLQQTYTTLLALKAHEERGATMAVPGSETPPPRSNWRTSITKHTVTCLACGQTFKQLTRRHLWIHGLTAQTYRTTYGIPPTQPLAAKTVIAYRRQLVQEIRPWEKAHAFRKR